MTATRIERLGNLDGRRVEIVEHDEERSALVDERTRARIAAQKGDEARDERGLDIGKTNEPRRPTREERTRDGFACNVALSRPARPGDVKHTVLAEGELAHDVFARVCPSRR